MGVGVLLLVKGQPQGTGIRLSPRRIRLIAGFQILLGLLVGAAFFFVDAEGANWPEDAGHWGGTWGIVALIWLAVLAAIATHIFRKFKK